MKMTSGVRLNERRKRALERLQTGTPFERSRALRTRGVDSLPQWQERRESEIAMLKKRTGQLFN